MNVITHFSAARDYALDLRFQAMFAGAAVGIAICHLDGRILDANPALTTLLGYGPEQLTGTRINELNPEMDLHPSPDHHAPFEPPFEQLIDELMRGDRSSFDVEKCYRRKDGSQLWGHLTISLALPELAHASKNSANETGSG
ncbi:MAG: PAS domain-containing protein [Terriglobales bacterium]